MQYRAVTCNNIKYHAIGGNTMQNNPLLGITYHDLIWNIMTNRDLSISVVIWILSSDTEKWFFCPNGLLCPFGQKNHRFGRGAAEQKTILVWNGPKGSSCSLLNPFGSLCNVDKPSMLGHFWSEVDHFWAIPIPQSWTVDPRVKRGLSPGLFCIAYL